MDVRSTSIALKRLARDWVVWTFLGVFSLSLTGNVLLGWRLRSIQQKVAGPSRLKKTQAQVGMFIPYLVVDNLSGNRQTLKLGGTVPTVLYISSPSCIWCKRNLENIKYIASQKHTDFTFIGLSSTPDGVPSYVKKTSISFPIYIAIPPTNWTLIDFQGTPQTLIIGRSGIVEHNWTGAYVGHNQDEVESFFGLHLPHPSFSQ